MIHPYYYPLHATRTWKTYLPYSSAASLQNFVQDHLPNSKDNVNATRNYFVEILEKF